MKVEFVAGFGPVARSGPDSLRFWSERLGVPLDELAPGYFATDDLPGVNAFAIWPLEHAAQSTSRPLSPESLLVGVTHTPWMHP